MHNLWGLNFEIMHGKESDKTVADSFSGLPDGSYLALTVPVSPLYERVRDSWLIDDSLQKLIQDLEQDPMSHSTYTWEHQLLKH